MIVKFQIRHETLTQGALYLVAAAAIGYLVGDAYHEGWQRAHSLAAALALLNIGLLYFLRQVVRQPPQQVIKGEDPRVVRELEQRNRSLQWQVELLTALREMSRVVSDCVDFKDMIREVFNIVDGLLNTESLTLFIPDDMGDFHPAAHKHKQNLLFWDEIKAADFTNVYEAAENRCTLRILEDENLHLVIPLVADTEFIGIMSLELRLFGDPETRLRETERYESILMDMVKHIALVIKTDNLHTQGIQDGLTGLYTKRHFSVELEKAFNQSARGNNDLSLLMVDIDHFKKVNDTYGHLTGDIILKGVATHFQNLLRGDDSAFRFGGEELVALLKGSASKDAYVVAERIRKCIEQETFTSETGGPVKVTLSIGVSSYHPTMKHSQDLVSDADKALYECKENGRNQSRLAKRKTASKR